MKNKIVILNNGEKEVARSLIKVEEDNKSYIIYTKDEFNDCGDLICYGASYAFINGKQVIKPIKDEKTLEFLVNILMQIQSSVNKKEDAV